jgi:antibiotic biosynthesis monooxygenase (ABM) superfamily enzyme
MSAPTSVTDDLPVTVSFTRRADPAHEREMTAWIRAGLSMAETFPGFLGGGWVRPRGDADEWHMLCRFADQRSLAAWDSSSERQWWLRSAQGLAEVTRTERRTGIEGWFDAPVAAEVAEPRAAERRAAERRAAPPRWKQAVTIWLVFFPVSLLATVTLGRLLADVPVVLRVVVTTLALTPVMTYVLLPWMTARLDWWLHGRRWRDR